MLIALDWYLHKPIQVVIAGKADDETTYRMKQELFKRYIPVKAVVSIDPAKAAGSITFAKNVVQPSDKTTAYVCENFACRLPVNTVREFAELLENNNNS